jgi:very-short-patch-repair endonuclease
MQNNLYNKNLQPYANSLRKKMTKAEACLWKYALRAGIMNGLTFRRQRPILNYIVDFVCLEIKLIIEVDGYTHLLEETARNDEIKQRELENAGYTVIRFTDMEVLTGIKQVIDNILYHIEIQKEKILKSTP